MKVITHFEAVADLDLPMPIKTQLYEQLTLPFNNDMPTTSRFWSELGTVLMLIEDGDDIKCPDAQITSLLAHAIEHPEFVLILEDEVTPYLLALSITDDSGRGCYLLAPIVNATYPITSLLKHIER